MSTTTEVRLVSGDPMKTIAVAEAFPEIVHHYAVKGTEDALAIVARKWHELALPHTNTGRYLAGIRTQVYSMGVGVVVGRVYNTAPHADWVERGTGLYRSGPGSKRKIRPRTTATRRISYLTKSGERRVKLVKPKLSFPDRPDYAGNRAQVYRGRVLVGSIRGQHPQWLLRRARTETRERCYIAQRLAAYECKRRIKAML